MTGKSTKDTYESVLSRLSHLTPKEIESIIQVLKTVQNVKQEKEQKIPTSIYTNELSILEATVKYLKETPKLSSSDISKIIKRKVSTINHVYYRANKKNTELTINFDKPLIPFSIFSKKLTLFESIVLELIKQGHSTKQVSEILGRSYRTIWATHQKGRKKARIIK